MKQYLVALFVFLFGVLVVSVSIWRSRPPLVTLAAENISSPQEVTTEETQTEVSQGEDDYPLPYPGILPDHPLYIVKMIRDRIRLWLTRKPLARAELMLHYADKRVASSLALAEKGKAGLAVSTATKAEIYFERALNEVERADQGEGDTRAFYEKALKASSKHEMVLIGVLSRVPDEAQSAVGEALEKSRHGHRRATEVVGPRAEPETDEEVQAEESSEEESEAETEE